MRISNGPQRRVLQVPQLRFYKRLLVKNERGVSVTFTELRRLNSVTSTEFGDRLPVLHSSLLRP